MKVNELMIGDWVRTTETNEPHNVQILGIEVVDYNEMKYLIKVDNGRYDWHCELHEIEPIPLTPEVLARMGFTIEEVPKYDDTYTEDEYTATIKCVDIRKCEVEIEYKTYWKKLRAFNYDPHNKLGFTSIETQVEYVHELQHILKVMKVDKELELLKERRSNQ